MTILRLERPGAPTRFAPTAQYSVTVPRVSLESEPFGDDPSRSGTRFAGLDASTLVEPSRWEHAYLDWLAARAGSSVLLPALSNVTHAVSAAVAATDSWEPGSVPDGVALRRTSTRRGEARAVVRDVRRWLQAQELSGEAAAEACDDIVILVPGRSEVFALWHRELWFADIPTRSLHFEPIALHSLARWVVALVQLRRWATDPVPREHLRSVIEPAFWSQSAVAGETDVRARRLLRKLLISIRRDSFRYADWEDHVRRSLEGEELDVVLGFSQRLRDAVAEGPDFFARLERLLKFAGLRACVGATEDVAAAIVCDKTLQCLRDLAYEEERAGGEHPEVGSVGVQTLVEQRFRATWMRRTAQSLHGVKLMAYDAYDGTSSKLLFATGLGEGDYPVVPRRWDSQEEEVARSIGLLADDESVDDYIHDEMERLIRLACAAFDRCSGDVVLSYSTEGPGTEQRYPGPLLSLLVGGWSEPDWYSDNGSAEVFTWADEIPREPADALCWNDAALFAEDARFRRWLRELELPDLSEDDYRRLREIRGAADHLTSSREAFRERHPRPDELPRFGEYSGMLPGATRPPDAFSASALETYGQCGTKYFFSKVLRVSDQVDLSESLEATETGTIIHNAFAEAAHDVVDRVNGVLWSMCIEPGEDKEDAAARIMEVVDSHLDLSIRAFLAEQASMSEQLVGAVVARWSAAFRKWAQVHVVDRLPGSPTPEQLGADPTVAAARKLLRNHDDALELVRALEAAVEAGEVTSKSAASNFGTTAGNKALTKKALADAYADDSFTDLVEQLEEGRALADRARDEVEEEVRRAWSHHFNRDVVHAELAFGMTRDDSDPDSIPDPVTVHIEELDIGVRGQIDRVDWDRDRHTLAVRDFKTGRRKAGSKLGKEIAEGRHLQLPLYAMALEEMARQGHLTHLEGATTVEVSLEYPRDPPSAAHWRTELRLDQPSGYELAGEPERWGALSRAWLGSHVRNIQGGHFPLLPDACPKENTGWCDFDRCCGYTSEFGRRAEEPRVRRPDVEPILAEGGKIRFPCPEVAIPHCWRTDVDEHEVRAMHDHASAAAADVSRDVAIAAGAGTGKTYNLVLRYLAALSAGASPAEILCITFTRRAASEMKSRIREALLSEPEGPQKPFVEKLRADPASFRRLLLSLSSAPITTIDSLAGRVFREAEAFRARQHAGKARSMEVVTDNDVADQLRTFVRQQFLEGIEQGDPHLQHLAQLLDPIAARDLLLEACKRDISEELASIETLEERAQALAAGWYRIMDPAATQLREAIRYWPLDEFEAALDAALAESAQSKRPSEEGAEWMQEFLRIIRSNQPLDERATWGLLRDVFKGSISQTRFGKAGLANLYRDEMKGLKGWMEANDPSRWTACDEWMKSLDNVDEYAVLAAHATFVAQAWAQDFREYLVELGRVRFSDVEVLATQALEQPGLAQALGPRFPYRHVFLDEAQDTSYSQIRLLSAVRKMAQTATGQPCREFVVGDVKQSIYAFRGAEVDVFTRRVNAGAERFTVNRRSTPSLLRAFNQLFDGLFSARAEDGLELDPRAQVPFESLAWPDGRQDTEDAAVELLAVPGESWFETDLDVEEEREAEEEPEVPEEVFRATPLQRGLARRISELIAEYPPGNHGASIAILVGSWRRADFYRDLLDAYDIPAAVQGGRGLLNSPEVDGLVQWLEAAAYPNRKTAFLGCLRGPGIAISDAGLYCLRTGHGVEGLDREAPHYVKPAVLYGTFTASAAAEQWLADDPGLATDRALYLLRRDEQGLDRFRTIWDGLSDRLGVQAPSDTIAWLADSLGIWSFWHAREGGRQAIANIRSFLDLVRDLESSLGRDPWVILRRLDEMRDTSDPAAGGLDASGGAPVVVTTYWQAKGMEWPVVVLPDLDKTRVRGEAKGLGDNRICIVDDELAVVHTPEVRESKPEKPIGSSVTAVSYVLDQYRWPAQRAEIRRLLYVAMTRAKEKLIMSATFNVPTTDNPESRDITTLHGAKDWATTMRICLDVQLNPESLSLQTGEHSLWRELEDAGRVQFVDGELYGQGMAQSPLARRTVELPAASDALSWRVVPPKNVSLLRPSDMVTDHIPPVDAGLSTPLPDEQVVRDIVFHQEGDEGTTFHAVMEHLAFGEGDVAGVLDETLAELRFDLPSAALPRRRQAVMELVQNALAAPIAAELRAAALRGQLYHELPLRFVLNEEHVVYGVIDLVWRDEDGRYHVLDYKTGFRYPTASKPATDQARHHFAQTRLYAEGLARCGFDVASFGLWYVAAPSVRRWSWPLEP